jgi:hypothetical protein
LSTSNVHKLSLRADKKSKNKLITIIRPRTNHSHDAMRRNPNTNAQKMVIMANVFPEQKSTSGTRQSRYAGNSLARECTVLNVLKPTTRRWEQPGEDHWHTARAKTTTVAISNDEKANLP